MPDSDYYAQQAKLLFAMASATQDKTEAARISQRANEYLILAQAMGATLRPMNWGRDPTS